MDRGQHVTDRRRGRWRWWAVVVLGVVAAVAVVTRSLVFQNTVGSLRGDGETSGGGDELSILRASIPADVGQPVAYGLLYVKNHGNLPVTVDRVEPIEMMEGLEVVDSYLVDPDKVFGIGIDAQPLEPEHTENPVPTQVSPGERFEVLIRVSTTSIGRFIAQGLAIEYHDADASYRYENARHLFAVCAPAAVDCPIPPLPPED